MAVTVSTDDRLPLGASSHLCIPIDTPFNKLMVKSAPFRRQYVKGIFYECLCQCGTSAVVRAKSLHSTISCGCHRLQVMSLNGRKAKGRQLRKGPRICKDCGQDDTQKPFPKFGRLCKECRNVRNSEPGYLQQRRLSVEKSPQTFLKMLFKFAKYRYDHQNYHQEHQFSLTREDVLALWEKQVGRCAISNLRMQCKRHSLYSASIDRIKADEGYTASNTQLVCKSMNLAKQSHSNDEMFELISAIIASHPSRRI